MISDMKLVTLSQIKDTYMSKTLSCDKLYTPSLGTNKKITLLLFELISWGHV